MTIPRNLSFLAQGASSTGVLSVPYGGTGLTTLTANYIPYGNGTGAFNSSSTFNFNGTTLSSPALTVSGNSVLSSSTGVAYVGNSTQLFAEKFQMYGNYAVFSDGTYTGFMGKGSAIGGGGTSDFGIRSLGNIVFVSPSATEIARLHSSGGVSIGNTTDPGATNLSVTGNVLIGGGTTGNFSVKGSGSTSATYATYIINSASTGLFLLRNDGYAFLPSTYSNTIGSAANMYINTDGSLYRSTSSLKYKTNVQDATHGLADVMKLRSVTYQGKNEADKNNVYGGLIAEEVHDAGLTEFVQYAEDGSPDALAYGNMVSLAIKAIQELKLEFDEYKATHP